MGAGLSSGHATGGCGPGGRRPGGGSDGDDGGRRGTVLQKAPAIDGDGSGDPGALVNMADSCAHAEWLQMVSCSARRHCST